MERVERERERQREGLGVEREIEEVVKSNLAVRLCLGLGRRGWGRGHTGQGSNGVVDFA